MVKEIILKLNEHEGFAFIQFLQLQSTVINIDIEVLENLLSTKSDGKGRKTSLSLIYDEEISVEEELQFNKELLDIVSKFHGQLVSDLNLDEVQKNETE